MVNHEGYINTILVLRNDTSTNWEKSNYKFQTGEVGLEIDGQKVKMKIGIEGKTWSELDYFGGSENQYLEFNSKAELDAYEGVVNPGDVAVIKTLISGEDNYSYTSYVFDNNTKKWKAMDGNYNAENIYFDEDLLTTTPIGNIKLDNGQATIPAAGKNLIDLFNTLYVAEDSIDLKKSNPSASISGTSTTYCEIGTTATKNITLSLTDDGEYKYGCTAEMLSTGESATSIINDGSTGANISGYQIEFDGVVSEIKSTTTFSLSPEARNSKASLSVVGKIHYGDGNIPVSNLKKAYPDQRILASNTYNKVDNVFRWYVPMYYGFTYSDTVINNPKQITASEIKALTRIKDADAYNETKKTTATATKSWRQFFLAIPKSYSWTMTEAKDANNLTLSIEKANDVSLDINGVSVEYSVFYIHNAAEYDTKTISWKL